MKCNAFRWLPITNFVFWVLAVFILTEYWFHICFICLHVCYHDNIYEDTASVRLKHSSLPSLLRTKWYLKIVFINRCVCVCFLQVQKTSIKVASRQKPRQQTWCRDKVQRDLRGLWNPVRWYWLLLLCFRYNALLIISQCYFCQLSLQIDFLYFDKLL